MPYKKFDEEMDENIAQLCATLSEDMQPEKGTATLYFFLCFL